MRVITRECKVSMWECSLDSKNEKEQEKKFQ